MKGRLIFSSVIFALVFFGLLSMVGNVHVAEFYGILVIAVISSIISWFKYPEVKQL
ncbi:hypothetical protein [Thiomicrospira microaerophila]|uniref:hypothetical protein n=1 Tax=Thiomicrospira microaerophila TaxID=406020 RepID=UPI0012FE5B72|nr:hypothetical protein [Thiomicrospira microaerophila]